MQKWKVITLILCAALATGCTTAYVTEKASPPTPTVVMETPTGKLSITAALRERLKGPTEAEKAAGKSSWFSASTAGMLKSVTVKDGRAIVDFADFRDKMSGASTSAGSAALIAEISKTVFQFPEVTEAEYRFNGSCDAFWEWLQRGCTVVPASQYR